MTEYIALEIFVTFRYAIFSSASDGGATFAECAAGEADGGEFPCKSAFAVGPGRILAWR